MVIKQRWSCKKAMINAHLLMRLKLFEKVRCNIHLHLFNQGLWCGQIIQQLLFCVVDSMDFFYIIVKFLLSSEDDGPI